MLGVPIRFYVEERSVGASNLYFGMIGFVFHCLPKIESSPGDRVDTVDVRSWVLIDVAVQPRAPFVTFSASVFVEAREELNRSFRRL